MPVSAFEEENFIWKIIWLIEGKENVFSIHNKEKNNKKLKYNKICISINFFLVISNTSQLSYKKVMKFMRKNMKEFLKYNFFIKKTMFNIAFLNMTFNLN